MKRGDNKVDYIYVFHIVSWQHKPYRKVLLLHLFQAHYVVVHTAHYASSLHTDTKQIAVLDMEDRLRCGMGKNKCACTRRKVCDMWNGRRGWDLCI